MPTKTQLEVKLDAYRAESKTLHAKLEELQAQLNARRAKHNICDTVAEFIDDCTQYVVNTALVAKGYVPNVRIEMPRS